MDAAVNSLNEHVVRVVTRYLSLEPPGALMLDGPWGSGKTFLIKKIVRDENIDHAYVSLNGVKTAEEFQRRLIYSVYPVIGDKTVRALGALARGALGVFRFKADLKLEDLVEITPDRLLIFDDLERCLLPIEETLGLINEFVEHERMHALVLANDRELQERSGYARIKEKTVYRTVAIRPDPGAVLADVSKETGGEYREFLQKHSEQIVALFEKLNVGNLRTLSNSIQEFEEAFERMRAVSGVNDHLVLDAFSLFFVLNFGARSGAVSRENIQRRMTDAFAVALARQGDSSERLPLEPLQSQVPEIDLYSPLLDNEFLEGIIFDGILVPETLQRSIAAVAATKTEEGVPAWRLAWYFMQNEESVSGPAFKELVRQVESLEITDPGEVLHAFGLLLEFSELGYYEKSKAEILELGKEYIAKLRSAGRFVPDEDTFMMRYGHGAAHGLGFMQSDTEEFREIARLYFAESDVAKQEALFERLEDAANSIASDSLPFRRLILWNEEDGALHRTPCLHHLDVKEFAENIMNSNASTQFEVLGAIASRQKDDPEHRLAEERPWIADLRSELLGRLNDLSSLRRARIARLVEWYLTPASSEKASASQ